MANDRLMRGTLRDSYVMIEIAFDDMQHMVGVRRQEVAQGTNKWQFLVNARAKRGILMNTVAYATKKQGRWLSQYDFAVRFYS